MAIIILCLLAQMYQHASTVIQSLVEEDINVKFLVQLDKLVRLFETPIFAYLRLQLLEPGRYVWLLKALYGLLMLLPQQSATFKILQTRLKTVPSYSFNGDQLKQASSGNPYSQIVHGVSQITLDGDITHDNGNLQNEIDFASRLRQFEQIQQQHRMLAAKSQSRNTSISFLKEGPKAKEPRQPATSYTNRPPLRLSKKSPGQS